MKKERDAGRTRLLGVSNVSLRHLEQMIEVHPEAPAFDRLVFFRSGAL
jgi:diketogulonate reductase-like aldo/keto reductase